MASYFQEKNDIPVFDYVIKENNKFLKESRNILQKMTGNLTQDQQVFDQDHEILMNMFPGLA